MTFRGLDGVPEGRTRVALERQKGPAVRDQLTVTTRDLRRLSAVSDPSHLDGPCDPLPISMLQTLADLVPCDTVTYQAQDPSRRITDVAYQDLNPVGEDDDALEDFYWDEIWPACPWNPPRTGDYVTIHRSTDHQSAREFASSVGAEFHRQIGLRHLVTVPLPPRGSIDYRIMLWRVDGRNFSEREVALLTVLRPHLVEMHRAVLTRTGPTAKLTKRQLDVLHLVAAGHTNVQIARRLGISEGTVRRHMENIFERMHVASRTEAAGLMNLQ